VRILAVGDVVDPLLHDQLDADRWAAPGIDLIVSCGDLPPDYLARLASRLDRPLLYVLGNHDGRYRYTPPEGCRSIDGRLVRWGGLRILGLGGAPPHNGGTEQHSERAMEMRLLLLKPILWRLGGIDLVVTHAPPRFSRHGLGAPSPASPGQPGGRAATSAGVPPTWTDPGHRGFAAFARLLHAYQPRVLLHGHTHLGYGADDRECVSGTTRIVNVYGHHVLEL
jgi:predicted phosphodiesterase